MKKILLLSIFTIAIASNATAQTEAEIQAKCEKENSSITKANKKARKVKRCIKKAKKAAGISDETSNNSENEAEKCKRSFYYTLHKKACNELGVQSDSSIKREARKESRQIKREYKREIKAADGDAAKLAEIQANMGAEGSLSEKDLSRLNKKHKKADAKGLKSDERAVKKECKAKADKLGKKGKERREYIKECKANGNKEVANKRKSFQVGSMEDLKKLVADIEAGKSVSCAGLENCTEE